MSTPMIAGSHFETMGMEKILDVTRVCRRTQTDPKEERKMRYFQTIVLAMTAAMVSQASWASSQELVDQVQSIECQGNNHGYALDLSYARGTRTIEVVNLTKGAESSTSYELLNILPGTLGVIFVTGYSPQE